MKTAFEMCMGFQLSESTKPYVKVPVYPLQGKRRKKGHISEHRLKSPSHHLFVNTSFKVMSMKIRGQRFVCMFFTEC